MLNIFIGFAILTFVFAYLTVNINKMTDDKRFLPLIFVCLVFTIIFMLFTSDSIMQNWNITVNQSSTECALCDGRFVNVAGDTITDLTAGNITADYFFGDGSNLTSVNADMVDGVHALMTKVLIDTYEGDGNNNRKLDLGDDYDEIHIRVEESIQDNGAHLVHAWAVRTEYGMSVEVVGGYTYSESMAAGDPQFQGKLAGGDVNKVGLGGLANTASANAVGWTYRIIAFKYDNVQTLP